MGALLTLATSAFAAPEALSSYEVEEFVADFTRFKPGDKVPAMYLTDEYNITKWQLRNLPAPEEGARWTYMGGNYVQITEDEGKIVKIYNGDIFFHR